MVHCQVYEIRFVGAPRHGRRHVSRHLTSLAPQQLHGTEKGSRFPCSEHFDRVFRKHGAPDDGSDVPSKGRFDMRLPASRHQSMRLRVPNLATRCRFDADWLSGVALP